MENNTPEERQQTSALAGSQQLKEPSLPPAPFNFTDKNFPICAHGDFRVGEPLLPLYRKIAPSRNNVYHKISFYSIRAPKCNQQSNGLWCVS